jgi:hypothetical protein
MKQLVWLFLILFLMSCSREEKKESAFTVGAASAPINPPIGAYIAGDKQNRTFTAVHDSLYVKAVVINDGKSSLAIVTFDCIGLLYTEVQQIRERTAAITSFPVERIVVSSTHTHSGPDVVGIWGPDYQHSGVDTTYMNFIVNTAAGQIKKADESKREAIVVTGESTFGESWVQNICNEEIDRSVTVMQFKDKSGNSIASLTNFACHPTFMDAKFTEVSADYVNGFYKQLNQQWQGVNLFLQGPIGGWVQPVDGEGSFEKAERRGRELATEAITAVETGDTLKTNAIRFTSKVVKFPVGNEAWKQLSAIGTIKRSIQDSVTTELVWFAIGDAQFATHPGETAPYYGLETKRLMRTGPRFVLGLSMDALGYILKPTFFEDPAIPHAEYLTSMSVGKETGPLIMKSLEELIEK